MAGTFDNVDLSQLPQPAALQVWTFAGIVSARVAQFGTYWTGARAIDPTLPAFNTGSLESSPVRMLQETGAYREGLLLQDINDAVLATSLAYAEGDDLVVRAADYATAKKPGESTASLRRRAQLSWENLSLGGTYGGYTYRALSVAPDEIGDVMVYGHEVPGVPKGCVYIVVMAAGANPNPSPALLARIQDAFPRRGRKVNDLIKVVAANVIPYTIDATLLLKPGADADTIVSAQTKAAMAYATARQVITGYVDPKHIDGQIVTPSPSVVDDVALAAPAAPIGGGPFDVPWCTGLRIVPAPAD